MFTIRYVLRSALSLSLAIPTIAQQPVLQQPTSQQPASQQGVRIPTNEVLLDVLVHDKKGRPVWDLKPEEIEVFEDGVKQPITRFTLVGAAHGEAKKHTAPTTAPESDTAPVAGPRQQQLNLVTLLFDHLTAVRVQPVRDAAYSFVDNSVTENMLVRVMVMGKRMYVIEQFTNDRAKLRKAVERATGTVEKSHAELSDRIAEELKAFPGVADGPDRENAVAINPDALLARVTLETLAASEKMSREVKSSLRVFPLLPFSRAHRHVPGRKMALYFSDGLYMPQGFTEVLRAAISEANRANVSFYSINIRNLLAGAGNQSSRLETATVINQTRRPETSTYNSGLADSFSVSDRYQGRTQITTNFNTFEVMDRNKELNKQSPLTDLTEGTGGFQITTSNEMNGTLKRIATELSNYYAISYLPTRQEYDGKFRAITVKIARNGLKAKTRNGYFALPQASNSRPVVAFETPLLAALNGAVVPHDFTYRSATMHFESRQNETHCEALLELPLATFIHEEDKAKKVYPVAFALMAMVKDENGEVLQNFSEPHEMEIPAAMIEDARKSSFTLTRHFWLAPGRYTLETAAHDQKTGKLSAERKPFTVALARRGLQTSSLSLIKRVEQVDAQNNSDPDNPLLLGDKRVIPDLDDNISTASRNELSFHLAIFPDAQSADPPQLRIELLHDDKVIGASSPALSKPDERGRITFTAGVNAANFTPGNYRFHAKVKQGDQMAEEAVDFFIPGERKKDLPVEENTIASSLSASDKVGELTLTALKTVTPLELSPADLIREVETTGASSYTRLGEYTYSLRKVRRVLTSKGKIKDEDYQDYEAYPVRGKHALIQFAENGSRLSNIRIDLNRKHATDMLVKSDEELRKLTETEEGDLNRKIGYWGASLEGQMLKRGQPNRRVFITIDPEIIFRSCEFTSPRSLRLDGRETIVLDFRPRAGVQTDLDKEWINQLSGTIWIDAADKSLVRIEGQGIVNSQIHEPSAETPLNLVYQQQRLADGLWAPSLIRINAAGNERLFQGLNWDAWFQFTNFKRFDSKESDVKIISPENKDKQ